MNDEIISKENVLKDLFSKQRFGIKPGLERTLSLCESAGNPQNKFKSVHVAGTNGKGSVCSAIASIIMESGYKTGLYTSPHLVDFNERIRINHNLIDDNQLVELYKQLSEKSDEIGATFFEITTVMAFLYFAENNVDIAVIETGMGGRFDSTNVLSPLFTVITKIDSDHNEYLGDSIQKIAYEKAGIIKLNTPSIVSRNTEEVYKVIESNSLENKIIYAVNQIDLFRIGNEKSIISKWHIKWNDSIIEFEYPIPGSHQKDNLAAVFSAITELSHYFNIEKQSIINGLKNVRQNAGLHARIELLSENPLIIVDGSHNSGSIENLFETLSEVYHSKKWNMIFAVMADKDIGNVFEYIIKYADSVTVPKLKIDRALNSDVLAEEIFNKGFENVISTQSVNEALRINEKKDNILIFGSFYLAGEVLEIWHKKSWIL